MYRRRADVEYTLSQERAEELERARLAAQPKKKPVTNSRTFWINGSHNGLKPSHEEFSSPVNGHLVSPQLGELFVGGPKLTVGGLGGGWELENTQ